MRLKPCRDIGLFRFTDTTANQMIWYASTGHCSIQDLEDWAYFNNKNCRDYEWYVKNNTLLKRAAIVA